MSNNESFLQRLAKEKQKEAKRLAGFGVSSYGTLAENTLANVICDIMVEQIGHTGNSGTTGSPELNFNSAGEPSVQAEFWATQAEFALVVEHLRSLGIEVETIANGLFRVIQAV